MKPFSQLKSKNFWLLKSEPHTYSFSQLIRDRKTNWNDVRNYQARNALREACVGDFALIYHSGDERAVVGIAEVIKEAYPDPDPEMAGDWVQIDLKAVAPLQRSVELKELKANSKLKDLPLIKQSRLSCMRISPEHFKIIIGMSEE